MKDSPMSINNKVWAVIVYTLRNPEPMYCLLPEPVENYKVNFECVRIAQDYLDTNTWFTRFYDVKAFPNHEAVIEADKLQQTADFERMQHLIRQSNEAKNPPRKDKKW